MSSASACRLVRASRAVASRSMSTAARPLSPHLTIYKFRTNMITSVIFRGTGMAMTAGVGGLAIAGLFASGDVKEYIYKLQQYPLINAVAKFGVAFPLSYHLMGGLRHLTWDTVRCQTVPFVRYSGWAATGAATAIGLAAMVYECDGKDE